jgi:soluble lytic murein transglycosylase-like protein
MPRARSKKQADWQTAAPQENGSGCLSLYSLSILAVFFITCLIAALALNSPVNISAAAPNIQTDSTHISPIFTREVQHWSANIIRWANASALDPNLVAVILQIESCGNPAARSSVGAMGLFQVMPFHFRAGENPYDTETNALRGLSYLARSLQAANGDARLALAGYNGGIGMITRSEWAWPAETKRYIYYGAPIYADASNGATSSATLDEWYGKYGAGLCRDASQRLGL